MSPSHRPRHRRSPHPTGLAITSNLTPESTDSIDQLGNVVDLTTWRRHRLLDAGFDATLAAQLAADVQRDLHALLQLVDRGCPPELAARILSPNSDEVGR